MTFPADPTAALTAIVALPGNEQLTAFGFGISRGTVDDLLRLHGRGTPAFRAALAEQVQQARAQRFEPEAGAAFTAACDWLRTLEPTQTPSVGSYGLKHTCERAIGSYVTNGTLICAAFAVGLVVRRQGDSTNADIGVSRRSVERAERSRG